MLSPALGRLVRADLFVVCFGRSRLAASCARRFWLAARVMRRHLAAGPPEESHQLALGRAVLCRARGARLAEAVGRAGHLGPDAGLHEPVAEAFLYERSPALGHEERQIARLGRSAGLRQRLKDGEVQGASSPAWSGLRS